MNKKSLTVSLVMLFSVLTTGTLYAQQQCIDLSQIGTNAIQCVNIDINYNEQTGMFSWGATACSQYNHPRHTYITAQGTDDLCPMISMLPKNGTQSIRLASEGYGSTEYYAKGEAIAIKYTVTEDNYIATLKYAAAIEVPQHSISQYLEFWQFAQPWINIYIAEGNTAIESSYTQHAYSYIQSVQGWSVYNNGRVPIIYRDWTAISYDLSTYIGQTISIVAEVYDCAEQDYDFSYSQINTCDDHHTAHMYLTVECNKIEEEQDCTAKTTTLTIPEGFTSYAWYNSKSQSIGSNQTITLPLPDFDDMSRYYLVLANDNNDLTYQIEIGITNDCNCSTQGSVYVPPYVCADAKKMDLITNFGESKVKTYDIVFDQQAQQAGLQNITGGSANYDGSISLFLPSNQDRTKYLKPDTYYASLTLHLNCKKDTTMNIQFQILYPSWVIRQQWNDVLAVLNKDYNGGYEFTNVRWFKGDNGIEVTGNGAHHSYLYVGPYAQLEMGVPYWAELTRKADGRAVCTCAMYPQASQYNAPQKPENPIQVSSVTPYSTENIKITAEVAGYYYVYAVNGMTIAQGYINSENNDIEVVLPHAGAYVVYFVGEDGTTDSQKWIVQ